MIANSESDQWRMLECMFKITSFQRIHSIFTGFSLIFGFPRNIFVEKCIEINAFSIKCIAFGKPLFLWYNGMHYAYVFDQVIFTSTDSRVESCIFREQFLIFSNQTQNRALEIGMIEHFHVVVWMNDMIQLSDLWKDRTITLIYDLTSGWKLDESIFVWIDQLFVIFIVQCFSTERLYFVE